MHTTYTYLAHFRLMQHFRDFEKHVKFVMNLVSILKVSDLTQENVSCLNTSLVIISFQIMPVLSYYFPHGYTAPWSLGHYILKEGCNRFEIEHLSFNLVLYMYRKNIKKTLNLRAFQIR